MCIPLVSSHVSLYEYDVRFPEEERDSLLLTTSVMDQCQVRSVPGKFETYIQNSYFIKDWKTLLSEDCGRISFWFRLLTIASVTLEIFVLCLLPLKTQCEAFKASPIDVVD